MREEEKEEEEKKQKRNGQLPSAKRGLFFYCRTMGKMSRTRTTGPSNIFRNSLSRGGGHSAFGAFGKLLSNHQQRCFRNPLIPVILY